MNSDRSGIYSIRSVSNKKIYIGSAVNIKNRFNEHTRKLRQNRHFNGNLQNTWNKYGADDLIFNILRFCKKEELLKHEQVLIDGYKKKMGWENMFNINPTAGSSLGRICSEKTKEKIRVTKIGKRAWNKGLTKKTDERVKKYSEKLVGNNMWKDKKHPRGMLGKKHSVESKLKIGKSSSLLVYDKVRNSKGQFSKKSSIGIVYYTDNQLADEILKPCQKQLKKAAQGKKIVSASLKPMDFGENIVLDAERGYLTMYKQILAALDKIDTDIVFLCEHDILYHPDHFDFVPPKKDVFYYNKNYWFLRYKDGHAIHYDVSPLSSLCAFKEPLVKHFQERVQMIEKDGFSYHMGFEPMTHGRIKWKNQYDCEIRNTDSPNIDICHEKNLTKKRWSKDKFRKQPEGWQEADIMSIPGWDNVHKLLNLPSILKE